MTLTELKTKFLRDILRNRELVELIDAAGEFTKYPDDLMDKRIFTWWQFKDDVLQQAKVLLGLKVDFPNVSYQNPAYKNFHLGVLVLCHKNLMHVKGKNGNRVDRISEELEKMWTWDRNGLNFRLKLSSNYEDSFNHDFYSRTLTFRSFTDNNISESCVKRNA